MTTSSTRVCNIIVKGNQCVLSFQCFMEIKICCVKSECLKNDNKNMLKIKTIKKPS